MSRGRSESQVTELLLKLSEEINRSGTDRVQGSSTKLIKKACKHIMVLNGEVENLSQQIAELIASAKLSRHDADIISKLLEN